MSKHKRIFDIVAALIFLTIFSPIIMVIAILIRWRLGAPVFFVQKRPGYKGKVFDMVKFRTMSYKTSVNGKLLPDSKRLTPLGRILRASSLDEIPEFWNVLKGDMSIVGPRPLLVEYLPLYTQEQARRHEVRPGITGWAQINGRNAISWEDKFRHDVWYVDNLSFALDVKILLLTVSRVIRKSDINQKGKATMDKFRGTKTI